MPEARTDIEQEEVYVTLKNRYREVVHLNEDCPNLASSKGFRSVEPACYPNLNVCDSCKNDITVIDKPQTETESKHGQECPYSDCINGTIVDRNPESTPKCGTCGRRPEYAEGS